MRSLHERKTAVFEMKRLLMVLLLCTCLWITACGAPSEILTVEMRDYYLVHEPLLVSVVLPQSCDVSELIFQINGTIFHTQSLPTEEDAMFRLATEDGIQTAYLIVEGFWHEDAPIVLQFLPDVNGEIPYPENVWFGETEAFLPLFAWFENATAS